MTQPTGLRTERRGHVGVLVFDRPERRNALSPELLIALHETLDEWGREREIRAVILTGAGDKAFSSGYDIRTIPTDVSPETARRLRDRNPLELGLASVKEFPFPTIAMVNGHCFGAALNLALCCDLRIGAEDAAMGMPAARLGLVYPIDGVAQFARVLGMARAREVFFTARTYRGAELTAMGLVDRLVPRAELEATTWGLAEEISAHAPMALAGIKRVLNLVETAAEPGDTARREAEALFAASLRSEDAKEAQRAFVEKRKPRFTGR